VTTITLPEISAHTLHWNRKAKNAVAEATVSEGGATRVHARINENGGLKAQPISVEMLTPPRTG